MQYYLHGYLYNITAEITCQILTCHWGENSSSLYYLSFFTYSFSELLTMFLCSLRLIKISLRKSTHGIKHVPSRIISLI